MHMSMTNDCDYMIDELENKLSILKLENAKFFENIDFLNDEFVENEERNKTLKSHIKNLDKTIETLMKEKNTIKNTYNKLFVNQCGYNSNAMKDKK